MTKILFLLISIFIITGCAQDQEPQDQQISYEDGTYRGFFPDEVVVQFTLEDNVVTSISYRTLAYAGVNYRQTEDETYIGIRGQYEDLIEYLIGKDLRDTLGDLYEPGDIVTTTVDDVYSGATIRAGKVISAIRDGLNRGVYSY